MLIYPTLSNPVENEFGDINITCTILSKADNTVLDTVQIQIQSSDFIELETLVKRTLANWMLKQAGGQLQALQQAIANYTATDWQRWGL